MRSIYGMPSAEMAGDAERRVPIPIKRRKANADIYGMPSAEMAGDAERRVPIPIKRRKANAKHLWNAFRRNGRQRRAARANTN